jgi:predicted metal-dependent hydrolase
LRTTTQQEVLIDGKLLDYKLVRSKKRKYSLAMKLCKDGVLQINVPHKTPLKAIEDFIASKIMWVQNKQQQREELQSTQAKIYQDAESHLYIGKSYPLLLVCSNKSSVQLQEDRICVYHRKNASIKNQLNKWYKEQALGYFIQRTELLSQLHNFPLIKLIKVRYMKARWGSCSSHSVITYNIHLLKAPQECIDYVIIHELCHLIHPNHGKGFYRLQTKLNPNWKAQKKQLNALGFGLLDG